MPSARASRQTEFWRRDRNLENHVKSTCIVVTLHFVQASLGLLTVQRDKSLWPELVS